MSRRGAETWRLGCLAVVAACLAIDAAFAWAVAQVVRFAVWLLAALASA